MPKDYGFYLCIAMRGNTPIYSQVFKNAPFSICVARSVANYFGAGYLDRVVVVNSYGEEIFKFLPSFEKDRDIHPWVEISRIGSPK
jgi:hypothetical protein